MKMKRCRICMLPEQVIEWEKLNRIQHMLLEAGITELLESRGDYLTGWQLALVLQADAEGRVEECLTELKLDFVAKYLVEGAQA